MNWSGFYFGGTAGALIQGGTLNLTKEGIEDDAATDPHLKGTDFFGGALAGYNFQSGGLVYGLEGDIGFGSGSASVTSMKPNVSYDVWHSVNDVTEDVNGHFRGRIGWAAGQWLLFGAGGLAVTSASLNITGWCPTPLYHGSASADLVGFDLGAGAEYALNSHVAIRGEYLYDNYGSNAFNAGPDWQPRTLNLETGTVRVGVTFRY